MARSLDMPHRLATTGFTSWTTRDLLGPPTPLAAARLPLARYQGTPSTKARRRNIDESGEADIAATVEDSSRYCRNTDQRSYRCRLSVRWCPVCCFVLVLYRPFVEARPLLTF